MSVAVVSGAGASVAVVSVAGADSSFFAPPQATNAIAKPHTINIANTFFIVYRFIKLAANILGMSIFRPVTFEKIDDFVKWRFAFDY